MTGLIIAIAIGVVIWLVLPLWFSDKLKSKSKRKAMTLCCKIIGIAIIATALINYLINLLQV